jgi:serine/threonine protein kinase
MSLHRGLDLGAGEPPRPGRRWGRYLVLGVLGRGGMGVVFRAIHADLQRDVALKVVLPGEGLLEHSQRFRQEIRVGAGLKHRCLLGVLDAGFHNGLAYLAMPYEPAPTVAGWLDRYRRLPWPFVLTAAMELADVVDYLHTNKILHRDISPGNVFLTYSGQARLADFGLARYQDEASITATGILVGTLPMMAPEVLARGHYSEKSDLWALGCVLYVALTGHFPSESTDSGQAHRPFSQDEFSTAAVRVQGVPAEVCQLIQGLLRVNLEERTGSAQELKLQSEQILHQLKGLAQRDGTPRAWAQLVLEENERDRSQAPALSTEEPRDATGGFKTVPLRVRPVA